MKKIIGTMTFFCCFNLFAANPNDKITKLCVANEMIEQYPIYLKYKIVQDFVTYSLDNKNFVYQIFLRNPETDKVVERSFVQVKDGKYNDARLFITDISSPVALDIQSCF